MGNEHDNEVVVPNSGVSMFGKMQFALAQLTIWIQTIFLGQAATIYALVFSCDIGTLGAILFCAAIFDCLINPYVGLIQDKESLSRWFSVERYGRRAPWFLTHAPIQMLTVFLICFPFGRTSGQDGDAWDMYVWFAAVIFIGKWASTVCGISVFASMDEIFPTQRERARVWSLNMVLIWIGLIVAMVSGNIIIGDSDNSPDRCCAEEFANNLPKSCEAIVVHNTSTNMNVTMYIIQETAEKEVTTTMTMALVCVGFSFLGLFSVPIMKLARQPADKNAIEGNIWDHVKYFFTWRAYICQFVHLVAESTGNGLLTAFAAFYMNYVLAYPRDEFTVALISVTLMGALFQMIGVALCGWYFGTNSERSASTSVYLTPYALVGCLLSAVVTPTLLLLADNGYEDDGETKKKGNFVFVVACFAMSRLLESPSMAFNGIARGWIVDMDVSRSKTKKRREGLIQSLNTIGVNLSGIFVTVLLASVSAAGLDTTKCWGEKQTKSSVGYLKYLLVLAPAILNLVRAFSLWSFPLSDSKVANIERKQNDIYVVVTRNDDKNSSSSKRSARVVPTTTTTP